MVATRPDECLLAVQDQTNGFNAVVQEAIMAPWWTELTDGSRKFVPIPAEPEALAMLCKEHPGMSASPIPAGYWENLSQDLPAPDFSDFLIFCRDDLPDGVAYLLTWIIFNTREVLERQFRQFPQHKRPGGWPMDPKSMARTQIPLHPGAEKFYRENNFLEDRAGG